MLLLLLHTDRMRVLENGDWGGGTTALVALCTSYIWSQCLALHPGCLPSAPILRPVQLSNMYILGLLVSWHLIEQIWMIKFGIRYILPSITLQGSVASSAMYSFFPCLIPCFLNFVSLGLYSPMVLAYKLLL